MRNRVVDYVAMYRDYIDGNSLDYLQFCGFKYIEELYITLSFMTHVSKDKLHSICSFPSISTSNSYLRKLMYNCIVSFDDTDSCKNYIEEHLLELYNDDKLTLSEKYDLLKEEPIFFPTLGKELYAYLASYVEYFFGKNDMEAPKWTEDSFYFLDYPHLDEKVDTQELMEKTKRPFLKRNYFCIVH